MSIVGGGPSSFGSGMKVLKMLRIVRAFRVFRFFKELALLALMIADSVRSLMWALIMLAIIIYVFAIVFTNSATDYLNTHPDSEFVLIVTTQFGNLSHTVYFLLMAMLGGIDWGEVADTLIEVGKLPAAMFIFYIMFSNLAVLNIITGAS